MEDREPFHEGERYAQEQAGSRARARSLGSANIHSVVPTAMREFFSSLDFVIAAVLDVQKAPRAFLVADGPNTVRSPTPTRLTLSVSPRQVELLSPGTPVGLLGIALDTGQRVRANGKVVSIRGLQAEVEVLQCFGNCPRHIHPRELLDESRQVEALPPQSLLRLDERARRMVVQADTFFIASCHPSATDIGARPSFGLDVSHRGGPSGFVRCDETGQVLTVPDYNGNSYFNTVGNLVCFPYAGLLFIDFERGDLLQLSVHAEVIWGVEGTRGAFQQNARQLRLTLTEATMSLSATPLRWRKLVR